jgi:hypothetical protein
MSIRTLFADTTTMQALVNNKSNLPCITIERSARFAELTDKLELLRRTHLPFSVSTVTAGVNEDWPF